MFRGRFIAIAVLGGFFLLLHGPANSHFRPETMIKALTEAVEKNPKNPRLYVRLSQLLRARGGLDNGYQVILKGLEANPGDVELLLEEAAIFIEQRRFADAARRIDEVGRREHADKGNLDYLSGLLSERTGESEKAKTIYERLAARQDASLEYTALARKGLIRYWTGRDSGGRMDELYKSYLRDLPADLEMRADYAMLMVDRGFLKEAGVQRDEIARLDPRFPLLDMVNAGLALSSGDMGMAGFLATRCMEARPRDPRGYRMLAKVLSQAGMKEEWEAFLSRARASLGQDASEEIRRSTMASSWQRAKTARIEAPEVVRFPSAMQGDKVGFAVSIRNRGDAPLKLYYEYFGSPFLAADPAVDTVPPGQTRELPMTLDTRFLRGRQDIALAVYSSDPASPRIVVRITGEVTPVPAPRGVLVTDLAEFSTPVREGEPIMGKIEIANEGDAILNISRVSVFAGCEIAAKFPIDIPPGGRREIPFRWSTGPEDPPRPGARIIRLHSNDPRTPEFRFIVVVKPRGDRP